MLAWLGIDLLRPIRLASVAIATQGAALAILINFIAVHIHRGNGILYAFYGPSIALRTTVIQALNTRGWHGPFAFARPGTDQYVVDPLNSGVELAPVYTDVPSFLLYPQSMNVMQLLIQPGGVAYPLDRKIEVRLLDPNGWRCDLQLIER